MAQQSNGGTSNNSNNSSNSGGLANSQYKPNNVGGSSEVFDNSRRNSYLSGLERANNSNRGVSPNAVRNPNYSNSSLPRGLSNNGSFGKNTPSGLENSSNNSNSSNNKTENIANDAKQKEAKKAVKTAAKAAGVPGFVTEMALRSKKGKQMMDKYMNKNKNPMFDLPGLGGKKSEKKKADSEKSIDEKSDEKQKSDVKNGVVTAELSLKTIKWLLIIAPAVTVVIFMIIFIVTVMSDDKVSSMILSEMTSREKKELIQAVKEGKGKGTGSGYGGADKAFPKEYYERLAKLGNNYSTQLECKGEKCLSRAEFLYYLKIADLSERYKVKYNVKLDWYLISATDLYFSKTTEEIMTANLGGYDADDSNLSNSGATTGLDWDIDYKNIDGYVYLDASNSTYDLQILAKNMVKKKTTQSCLDNNGNTISTQEDEDVEDKYFEVGGEKRLNCASGQEYIITSTYTKDMDKFNEFMLEYIDKKMYTRGFGSNGSNNPTSCITGNDNKNFIWPDGSMEITESNGKQFALGTPESTHITSYFGSTESFRNGSGHGAIDIDNTSGGVNRVPVIASKAGTVVYPTTKSQTQFADNGYIGNRDGDGYGNHVIIDHGDGMYTLYGHMAQNSITVMAGDKVEQGQVIGKIGNSGNSTGSHLHFEMRKGANSWNNRVDPLNYVDPENPRNGASTTPGSCSKGSNSMAAAFVNLAVAQKSDPSASGGQKYRDFLCPGCSHYHWCAAFVSWNIYNTEYNGQKLSDIINFKSTWVYEFMNYFYNEGKNNSNSPLKFYYNDNCSKFSGKNGNGKYTPKPGDLIFFDWYNRFTGMPTDADHVSHIGIVQRVENGNVITIEGNAGVTEKGDVQERSYPLNDCQIVGYGSWY